MEEDRVSPLKLQCRGKFEEKSLHEKPDQKDRCYWLEIRFRRWGWGTRGADQSRIVHRPETLQYRFWLPPEPLA